MKVCTACHYIFWQYEFYCPVCKEKEDAAWERAAPRKLRGHEKKRLREAKRKPSGSRTKHAALQAAYCSFEEKAATPEEEA